MQPELKPSTRYYLQRIAVAFTMLLGYTSLHAQLLQATRQHYSTDDGLASNAIAQLEQDDYGYIWLATWNGLSRFDGYNFYNYKTGAASHIPNLHNRISQIAIDNQQNVWMRMYDSRVFVMKRSTDCIINPFENVSGSEEFRTSHPITVTSSGDVLVNIKDVGLYRMRMKPEGISSQLITIGDLSISSMAEGYQDDIWLGTNQGVHRLDASNLTIERKGLFLDESITCLFSNGYNIFAGTESGKILSFSYGQEPQTIRSSGSAIANLFVDSHGIVWFTDPRMGVSRIDPTTHEEKFFTHNVKTPDYDGYGGLFTESNGVVWVAMNRGGFGYYNRERDEMEYFHNDPSNPWNLCNTINAMYITNDGVVFESTVLRGLEKLEIMNKNIERIRLTEQPQSTLDNEVRGIYYDKAKKDLLISNKSGNLYILHNDSSKTVISKASDGNPLGRIYGISKDSKGNYWLSSKDNGLFKMTPSASGYNIVNYKHDNGNENSLSDNRAYYCIEDKNGNLWIATYGGGVNLLPKGQSVFLNPKKGMRNYPINAYQKVRTVALDKDGKIWAGTTDGVLILSYKDGEVEVQKLKESEEEPEKILMSNDIVCIDRDMHGMMWVGTNGGGLAHTIGQDSEGNWLFEQFGAGDGLPSEEIKSLTFDNKGNVWFSTDHNICSYDIGKRIFATYSSLEGVDETICSEASAVSLSNGHLLFGTIDGYYHVDLQKLITATGSTLKLRITDFWVNDILQSPRLTDLYDCYIPDTKKVELPAHDSKMAFRFAALNYQLQHRVHYQYMLEGYDDDWINADHSRTATYEDIPSGTYKFKVKAFLINSPDKYDMREIEVVVPPPFFLSFNSIWLYLIILAVAAIAFMFWLQKRRSQHERTRRKKSNKSNINIDEKEDLEFMHGVQTWMEANYSNPTLNVNALISQLSVSLADFESQLKRITNMTPKEYVTYYRIRKAQEMLEQTNDSIADISFNTGFPNAVQFNRLFLEKTGVTPSQYRDKRKEELSGNSDTAEYEIIE